jgi:hypothetical protein
MKKLSTCCGKTRSSPCCCKTSPARRPVKQGRIQFANQDCDTGQPTRAGEYSLADKTYSQLLDDLNQKQFAGLNSELQRDILKFYNDPNSPVATKTKKDKKA